MISNSSTLSKPLKEATKEASYPTYFGGGTDSSSKEESNLKFTSNIKLLCGGGSSKELSNSLFEGKSALKIGSEESKNSKEYCEKSKELELVFNFGLEEGREISSEKSYHAGYVTAIFKYILIPKLEETGLIIPSIVDLIIHYDFFEISIKSIENNSLLYTLNITILSTNSLTLLVKVYKLIESGEDIKTICENTYSNIDDLISFLSVNIPNYINNN
jgi:hypothetical protein